MNSKGMGILEALVVILGVAIIAAAVLQLAKI